MTAPTPAPNPTATVARSYQSGSDVISTALSRTFKRRTEAMNSATPAPTRIGPDAARGYSHAATVAAANATRPSSSTGTPLLRPNGSDAIAAPRKIVATPAAAASTQATLQGARPMRA